MARVTVYEKGSEGHLNTLWKLHQLFPRQSKSDHTINHTNILFCFATGEKNIEFSHKFQIIKVFFKIESSSVSEGQKVVSEPLLGKVKQDQILWMG